MLGAHEGYWSGVRDGRDGTFCSRLDLESAPSAQPSLFDALVSHVFVPGLLSVGNCFFES